MKTVQVGEAEAALSDLVDAAEKGEPSLIIRSGRPAAMLLPIDMAQRATQADRPSFADFLLSLPVTIETERDRTPLPAADL